MNLKVCGIGHPLGLFFGVFSASSFFREKQCSSFDSSLPATSLAGCGGRGGEGGRGDSHRELTRRIVYKNHA